MRTFFIHAFNLKIYDNKHKLYEQVINSFLIKNKGYVYLTLKFIRLNKIAYLCYFNKKLKCFLLKTGRCVYMVN